MSIKEHPPQSDASEGEHRLHVPVLLETMLDKLKPQPGEAYLDLTAGYGGHARAFLERTAQFEGSVLVDRDAFALEHLQDLQARGVRLIGTDFLAAAHALVEEGKRFDLVIADLGVSSPQLDRADRGFSFNNPGPLDMRMDSRQPTSAKMLVNELPAEELTRIINRYGEEPWKVAQRIAQAIVQARPLMTTKQLADIIAAAIGRRKGKIHPATRTFQALRIAVNDELGQVEGLLPLLPKLLQTGGRVGIISFHSLEDRLVKRYFNEQANSGYEAELELPTKKPFAGSIYDVHHPRSRSAKLRIAVKK